MAGTVVIDDGWKDLQHHRLAEAVEQLSHV